MENDIIEAVAKFYFAIAFFIDYQYIKLVKCGEKNILKLKIKLWGKIL